MLNSNLHVAIVGHGSGKTLVKKLEGVDRVWGINALNLSIPTDLIFSVHRFPDRFYQMGEAKRLTTIASFERAQKDGTPVLSCHVWDKYPVIQPYPIDHIVGRFGIDYFTCSAAYALAYAIDVGVGKISLCGVTGRENADFQRPCIEFWCGVAVGAGIPVYSFGGGSDIMRTETNETAPVLQQWRYGYHHHPPDADKDFTLHLDLWNDEVKREQQAKVAAAA